MSSTAKEFGIVTSTLSTVLKNKDRVIGEFEQSFSSKWKRKGNFKFLDVQAASLQWLQNVRAANLPVGGQMTMEKADSLALWMGYTGLHCSNERFECFKNKNNVMSKPICGESGTVDEAAIDN